MLSLQQRIFEGLERQFRGRNFLVKWLEKTLDLDRSTARRKLTGESKLSIEQLEVLLQHFPGVVEDMLPKRESGNSFIGSYSQLEDYDSIRGYLKGVILKFSQAARQGAHLKYIARDLPLFFFLANPDLASYKFSMWTGELGRNGSCHILDRGVYALCEELFQLYVKLDTVEIWNKHIMRNQYHQIQWHYEMGYIDEAFRDKLHNVLYDLLLRYKTWAEAGQKEGKGILRLFFTDFITMNNGGLLITERQKVLMAALSSVNFVSYLNPVLCDGFEREFEKQKKSSILVSNSNALERERCFQEMVNGFNLAS